MQLDGSPPQNAASGFMRTQGMPYRSFCGYTKRSAAKSGDPVTRGAASIDMLAKYDLSYDWIDDCTLPAGVSVHPMTSLKGSGDARYLGHVI